MAIETTPVAEPATAMMRTLPRDAYLSEAQFAREADRIFHREWFAVGREATIPSAGDFLHVEVAGESVLITRARSGALHAFYNVCRHRGSRLVMDDPPPAVDGPSGRFKGSIRCPYHAWTYGLDGHLRNAPFLTESDGLRRDQLGLYPVAVDTWAGFIFVNLTPSELTTRSVAVRSTRRSRRSDPQLSARRPPTGGADHVPRRSELEDDRRELQRVLPLRSGAPGALRAGAGVQTGRRTGAGLGQRRAAPRWGNDVHVLGDDQPRTVPRALGGRADPAQRGAALPEPHAEPLGRPRRGVHALAARTRVIRGSTATSCSTPTRWRSRGSIRPTRSTSGIW